MKHDKEDSGSMAIVHLAEADLITLEEQASLMFTVKELAVILKCNYFMLRRLIKTVGSPESERFNRGRLIAEAQIRKSIFELAQNGSSPAQSQFLDLIENAKLDDVL